MTDPDLRAIFDGDAAQRYLYERRLALISRAAG